MTNMNPSFNDGDIIITEEYAARVTRTGRGWWAEVADVFHPANGLAVFGDKWAVLSMLREEVGKRDHRLRLTEDSCALCFEPTEPWERGIHLSCANRENLHADR